MADPSTPRSVTLEPAAGEPLWFFGGLLTFKATADDTGGGYVVAELRWPRGTATPMHVHREDLASFYVLDGTVTFWVGDAEPFVGLAGAFVQVEPGAAFGFRVDTDARLLTVTTPQHEQFFRAAGEGAPAATLPAPEDAAAEPNMDRIGAAAARYAVDIVGPPPPAATPARPDPLGPGAVPAPQSVH